MTSPQHPEFARTRRTAASSASAEARAAEGPPVESPETGPLPDDNRPGHHPPVEQDKPTRPPSVPERHHRFAFRREHPLALAGRPFGITSDNSYVDVDDERLEIRFGPWHMTTPMDNVGSAERTGPYSWWKVVGPPRLSLRDRGITFATTAAEGVCIRFRKPVPGAFPRGPLRHPAATVTVEDPDDLVRFLTARTPNDPKQTTQ